MNSSNTSLVLRVCRPDGTSHGGFQWPLEVGAEVVAPDWDHRAECGGGLHGWLYGQGNHGCVDHWKDQDAKWLVLEVESSEIVMLGEKCKFERCVIRFVGGMAEAAAYMEDHEPRAAGVAIIGACKHVGHNAAVAVGDLGTATAGGYSTATAGRYGAATAGYKGAAAAGYKGAAAAGYKGTATAGGYSTATAGDWGAATAGDWGAATAGDYGAATAGDYGAATAGYKGTAMAGEEGELRIRYWDEKSDRYRTAIAYVGEDGIKPDTAYKLDDNHNFIEVKS